MTDERSFPPEWLRERHKITPMSPTERFLAGQVLDLLRRVEELERDRPTD